MYLVEDLMTRELVTLGPDDDLSLAETIMQLGRIRHLPVVLSTGKLVGLITHRDLLRTFVDRSRVGGRGTLAKTVMTTDLTAVTPKTTLKKALHQMMHNKFGCLPVIDAEHRLVGLITEFDLVKFAARFVEDLDEVEEVARRP